MVATSRRPLLSLSVLTTLTRLVWWLVVLAWLVLGAVWALLHGVIVPRIDEFRPALESRASAALGMTVRIAAIAAHSDGFLPSFEMRGVELLDAQGHAALALPRVLVTVSPRSLWHLGFEQLAVDAPALEVRRDASGRLWVAGLEIPDGSAAGSPVADWVLSQREWIVTGGRVQWHDEMLGAPALALEDVRLRLRNTRLSHELRLDATPPAALGGPLTLRARMRQPLLFARPGDWRRWQGEIYVAAERMDWGRLREHLPVKPDTSGGIGALRVWAQVAQGDVRAVTADVALADLTVRLRSDLPALELTHLTGRLGVRRIDGGAEVSAHGLNFTMRDQFTWSGGDVRVAWAQGEAAGDTSGPSVTRPRGEVELQGIELASVRRLAQYLPLPYAIGQKLEQYEPGGRVDRLQMHWQGINGSDLRYDAEGRVSGLQWAAQPVEAVEGRGPEPGLPGGAGVSADFKLNQAGGQASVRIDQGYVEFPGVFDQPRIPMKELQAQVGWQVGEVGTRVDARVSRLSNADAEGDFHLRWQSDASATHHGPGSLDLGGTLARADVSAIHRYLPLAIPVATRSYLQQSLTAGAASAVHFRVRGALRDFPFRDSRLGEFRISANVRDARYAYVPRSLQPPAEKPWPALSDVRGDVVVDRTSLALHGVSARVEGAPQARIAHGEGGIADLGQNATVQVGLQLQGSLDDVLHGVLAASPVDAWTGGLFALARAQGSVDAQLALVLPLAHLEKSTVQGQVRLSGNDLSWAPDLPRLTRARGTVYFSEQGFALANVQARLLGGDVRAEGGTIVVPGSPAGAAPRLRVQGTLTAQGLRQAYPQGALAGLAQQVSGSTAYTAELQYRGGLPEFQLSSSLQGLGLTLPAPAGKVADASLPLRLQISSVATEPTVSGGGNAAAGASRSRDLLRFDLGRLVQARLLREHERGRTTVLRGAVAVGSATAEVPSLPASGVSLEVQLDALDLDAWQQVFKVPDDRGRPNAEPGGTDLASDYLPQRLVLRVGALRSKGQTFNAVTAGGTRQGAEWRLNMDARELSGYFEYRPGTSASAGAVYARLARLRLAKDNAEGVDTLLDEPPVSMPALDVVIDSFELRGKNLGRVEINAINRGAARRDLGAREWRLTRLRISSPEADLNASGDWAVVQEGGDAMSLPALALASSRKEKRRTLLDFQMDVRDAGGLLARMAMPGLLRAGKGRLEGQLRWDGSPLDIDYASLGGTLTVDVQNGQFLKADPGLAKLLGVLSLQSLPRRLTLDFHDVFSEGFAFDAVRGDIQISEGVARTNNLQMKGVSAAVAMSGQADLARETQDLQVVVVPEINAGTASLIATWINPTVGLSTFLAQLLLRGPAIAAATQEFQISGSWSDPQMRKIESAAKLSPSATPSTATP